MIDFTNKIITVEKQFIPNTILSPISKRISPELWDSFSNLNFAGVYRIGSETVKNECYIGSTYNITLKVTHHLNLLYRGEHHSKGLQDWVNTNGLEAIDFSILAWCEPFPDIFEAKEQYFLDLIKPKFNSILNKYNSSKTSIDERRKTWKPTYIFVDEQGEVTRIRGDITNLPKIKPFHSDTEVTEITIVRRNLGFVGR